MWTKPSSFFVRGPHIWSQWHFLKNYMSQDWISYAVVTSLPWIFLLTTQNLYATYVKFSGSWMTPQSSSFPSGSSGSQSAFNLHNIGRPQFCLSRKTLLSWHDDDKCLSCSSKCSCEYQSFSRLTVTPPGTGFQVTIAGKRNWRLMYHFCS